MGIIRGYLKFNSSFFKNTGALVGYCLLAIILTYPMILHLRGYYRFCDPGHLDILIQFWDFWWFKKSIIDLTINPLFCEYIFHPVGDSIVFQAHTPLYSLLSIPLQLVFGKKGIFLSYNLLVLFSFSFCGWGTYLLANYLIKNRYAAFVSGTLFTLCGIRLFNFSRLHILCMEFIPFVLLFLLKTVNEENYKNLFPLSFFLSLNFYNSFSNFLNVLLIGGCFLLSQLIIRKRSFLSKNMLKKFVLAVLIFLALTAPFILLISKETFTKNPYLFRDIEEAKRYSLDLASLFIPTEFDSIYGSFFRNLHFGEWDYTFSYFLGFTWIFLISVALLRPDKKKTFMLWLSSIILLFISLGPCLKIFGILTNINLPLFYCYRYLPFFEICGVPFRIVTGVYLCLSILAGYGASVLFNGKYFIFKKIPKPRNIFFIMLILILILIEAIDNYPVLKEPDLEFFRGNCQKLFYQQISKNNENYAILDLPIEGSLDRIYMLYQIYHEKKICCACLRRSLLNTYDFLDYIPLLSKVQMHENYNNGDNSISPEEISLNHKQLKNTNIKFVILHNILSESSNHKNEHTFSEYQIIIEKYQPIKKIVFNECIAYQFW